MKLLLTLSVVFVFLLIPIQDSFSELDIYTNAQVYSPEHTLQVYGNGLPGENLILILLNRLLIFHTQSYQLETTHKILQVYWV